MSQTQHARNARPDELIGGTFAVESGCPLPAAGGGVEAYAARDALRGRDGFMALRVRAGAPPRPRPLTVLATAPIPRLLGPLAHGVARFGSGAHDQFVVCPAPAGEPLGTEAQIGRRWNEAELVACVLRPIGAVLAELHRFGVTHRAIRPNNIFQQKPGQPVVLGAAWSAPPGLLQPPAFEPAYMAACLPAGRGDGSIADDVYALGVLLVAMAAGQMPMADCGAAEIAQRKITLGSYSAITAGLKLPQGIAELARALLAEDPEHRPHAAHLQDVEAVRGRRLAVRPARVAPRPLELGGRAVWHARGLAWALTAAPAPGVAALRDGSIDRWLRRSLGEGALANRLEEFTRVRNAAPEPDADADGVLILQSVAVLDPLAPLCWRGLAFWPDGLGPALAAAPAGQREELVRMLSVEALGAWASARAERCDAAAQRGLAREWRLLVARGDWGGGLAVLIAQLNPLERCASPALRGRPVASAADLVLELERLGGGAPRDQAALPLDRECAAFLAGQESARLGRELAALSPDSADPCLAQLRLLARLQTTLRLPPLPALAARLMELLRPRLAQYRGVLRRGRIEAAMDEQVAAGSLAGLLQLLDDTRERARDEAEAAAARAQLAAIDRELTAVEDGRDARAARARRSGQEVAAAIAAAAATVVAAGLLL